MRFSGFLFGLLLVVSPAVASEKISCVSLDGEQTAHVYVTFNDGRYEGTIDRFDVPEDEYGMTSEPDAEGRPGYTIALPEVDFDTISVVLENPSNARIVADLQISKAVAFTSPDFPENDEHVTVVGGTLSIGATGVWVVTCTGWE